MKRDPGTKSITISPLLPFLEDISEILERNHFASFEAIQTFFAKFLEQAWVVLTTLSFLFHGERGLYINVETNK